MSRPYKYKINIAPQELIVSQSSLHVAGMTTVAPRGGPNLVIPFFGKVHMMQGYSVTYPFGAWRQSGPMSCPNTPGVWRARGQASRESLSQVYGD